MAHAFMSPSFAHIGYECPAAAIRSFVVKQRMELMRQAGAEFYGVKDDEEWHKIVDEDNPHAQRGTNLHSVLEDQLTSTEHTLEESMEKYGLADEDSFVFERMQQIITETRVEFDGADEVHVERRGAVSGIPQFGTWDVACARGSLLMIRDLKGGRIEVDPKDNHQFMSYAVIIMDNLKHPEKIKEVDMAVLAIHFESKSHRVPVEEIERYKKEVMLPAFMAAYSINPKAKAGDHCLYCSGKLYCGEFGKKFKKEMDNEQYLEGDFKDAPTLELEDLFRTLKQAYRLTDDVSTELLLRYEAFDEPETVTRVNGRKYTNWAFDEKELVEKLSDLVTNKTELYNQKLKTPTQMKVLLGDEPLAELTQTGTGKPYIKI